MSDNTRTSGSGGNLAAANIAQIARDSGLRLFGLQIIGDALAPRLRSQELVIVDTDALAGAGDCAKPEVDSRLCAMLLNADGDMVDNQGGYVPRGAYFVIGVIIDREE